MTIIPYNADGIEWKTYVCGICGFTMINTEKPHECWNCKSLELTELDAKNDNKGL